MHTDESKYVQTKEAVLRLIRSPTNVRARCRRGEASAGQVHATCLLDIQLSQYGYITVNLLSARVSMI